MSRPACVTCGLEKPIVVRGLCFSCLSAENAAKKLAAQQSAAPVALPVIPPTTSKTELMDMLEASLDLLSAEQGKGTVIVTEQPKPTNGVANKPKSNTIQICDVCGNGFKSLQKDPTGKLMVCVECFTKEQNAAVDLGEVEYDAKNYKTWPRCNKCHAHVVREQLAESPDGLCFKCSQTKASKIDTLSVKPTDSNLYQEFFNAETQSIVELLKEQGEAAGILLLRQNIIDGKELLSKEEAAAFKTKTQLQARQIKYNDMLSKLSADEQNKLRIEDASYKPKVSGEARKHKSPLSQIEKTKKLKKSLDDQINSMFGGTLSAAEIAEKKKALGL
jgi:dimeric dUTPase (all-alpha-NTP-PPase superfamily)